MFLKVEIHKRRLAFALYRMVIFAVCAFVAFIIAGFLRGNVNWTGLTLLLPPTVLIFLPIALTSILKAVSESAKDQLIHAGAITFVTGVVVYFTVTLAVRYFFEVEEAQTIKNLSLGASSVLVGAYLVAMLNFVRKEPES